MLIRGLLNTACHHKPVDPPNKTLHKTAIHPMIAKGT
jgi:hypothetical protein